MNKKIFLYYAAALVTGILIMVYFLVWGFRLDFFGVGPCTYKSFAFFCLLYGTLGIIFTFSGDRNQNIIASILISLPMVLIFYLAMFSDFSPKEQLPRHLGALCPLLSALFATMGSNIVKRKIKKSK